MLARCDLHEHNHNIFFITATDWQDISCLAILRAKAFYQIIFSMDLRQDRGAELCLLKEAAFSS